MSGDLTAAVLYLLVAGVPVLIFVALAIELREWHAEQVSRALERIERRAHKARMDRLARGGRPS